MGDAWPTAGRRRRRAGSARRARRTLTLDRAALEAGDEEGRAAVSSRRGLGPHTAPRRGRFTVSGIDAAPGAQAALGPASRRGGDTRAAARASCSPASSRRVGDAARRDPFSPRVSPTPKRMSWPASSRRRPCAALRAPRAVRSRRAASSVVLEVAAAPRRAAREAAACRAAPSSSSRRGGEARPLPLRLDHARRRGRRRPPARRRARALGHRVRPLRAERLRGARDRGVGGRPRRAARSPARARVGVARGGTGLSSRAGAAAARPRFASPSARGDEPLLGRRALGRVELVLARGRGRARRRAWRAGGRAAPARPRRVDGRRSRAAAGTARLALGATGAASMRSATNDWCAATETPFCAAPARRRARRRLWRAWTPRARSGACPSRPWSVGARASPPRGARLWREEALLLDDPHAASMSPLIRRPCARGEGVELAVALGRT